MSLSYSHTKRGPGRRSQRGKAFFSVNQFIGKRQPRTRLRGAVHGGNYRGIPYLTYRESDLIQRLVIDRKMTRLEAEIYVISARPESKPTVRA